MKKFIAKGVLSLLLFTLVLPSAALAHPEPIKTPVLYNQTVSITSVTVDDDNNFFGPADLFFDYIVNALAPPHDEQSGITDTFKVSSGTTKSFDPPLKIYSHNTCHCDEEFDIDIAVFDHAPVQTLLGKLLEKGFDWLKAYLTGGTTGLVISVLSDLLELLIDALMKSGMSDEEAAYQAYVQIINESDLLGATREIIETECEPADKTYKSDLTNKEVANGWLTYRIVKTPTDQVCTENAEVGTVPEPEDDLPPEEPGEVLTPPEPEFDDATKPESESRPIPPVSEPEPESDEPPVEPGEPLVPPSYPEPATEPVADAPTDTEDVPADTEDKGSDVNTSNCLSAAKQAIDWATGTLSPNIFMTNEHLITWALGAFSCKNGKDVVSDYSSSLQEVIPSVNSGCPSLSFKGSQYYDSDGICHADFYFGY